MKVQTVYGAAALQGALHPHLRNFHRKEHTPRKILKQRTAGNLTIFPGIQIHGQIMLRRKKAQIFSGGEGSSYQESPDFIRQQNSKRQKKQKKCEQPYQERNRRCSGRDFSASERESVEEFSARISSVRRAAEVLPAISLSIPVRAVWTRLPLSRKS